MPEKGLDASHSILWASLTKLCSQITAAVYTGVSFAPPCVLKWQILCCSTLHPQALTQSVSWSGSVLDIG